MKIENIIQENKKFITLFNIDDYEIETENGWQNIKSIGKTIKYEMYELTLEDNLKLKCADDHIVIQYKNKIYNEIFIKNLKENDLVVCKYGLKKVLSIKNLNYIEEMYDIEIDSVNHTYFTNDILSHNTSWACNLAAKSVLMGYNTAYITLELQRELVHMRIGANMLNVPIDDYEALTHDQDLLKQKLTTLKQKSLRPLGELHVKEFPSSTASSNDIAAYLRKAQELLGYKFDNVFIDYLNIMKNWRNPNTEHTYMKIKQISEDVRAMGQENNWAIISVTQTNRSGWLTNDLNITSLSESGGLLQTVDMLFGIITDPAMKAKGEYYLKCLANRVGGYENCRKRHTMDWKYLRIEEDKLAPIQDMEFFVNSLSGQKQPRGRSTTTTLNAMISDKVKPVNPIPDNVPIKKSNITGSELFHQ